MIYLIGSLRNPRVPYIAKAIRDIGFNCFDDWYSPGPEADQKWQEHEAIRGRNYCQALQGYHAKDVFQFDLYHLDHSNLGILAMPAGKSGHLELGYLIGQGKPGYILLDQEPERWDIMTQLATGIFYNLEDLLNHLRENYDIPHTIQKEGEKL